MEHRDGSVTQRRLYIPDLCGPPPTVTPTRRRRLRGMEIVYELAPGFARPADHVLLEIFTRNHVYAVNALMICVGVAERANVAKPLDTPVVGAFLSGGEREVDADTYDFFRPYPVPGSMAVFEDPHQLRLIARTSQVERVLLHLSKFRVRAGGVDWVNDSSTGRFAAPTRPRR